MVSKQQEIDELFQEFKKNKNVIKEQQIKSAESVENKVKEKKAKLGSKVVISGSIINIFDNIPRCPYFYENPEESGGINLLYPYYRSKVLKNPRILEIPYILENPIFMR